MTELPNRRGVGRPAFRPIEEQRRQVEAMVGFGLRESEIVRLIVNPQTGRAIDEKTLRRHFRAEIDRGQVKANTAVAQSIYRAATNGNMTAAIFWAKARMGWKETTVTAIEWTGLEAMLDKLDKAKS